MTSTATSLARLRDLAAARGLLLNPEAARLDTVARLLGGNHAACGAWVCPCKQDGEAPDPAKDVCCPCPTLDAELAEQGHCHCRVFFRPGA